MDRLPGSFAHHLMLLAELRTVCCFGEIAA
jgi:hypothetical protein